MPPSLMLFLAVSKHAGRLDDDVAPAIAYKTITKEHTPYFPKLPWGWSPTRILQSCCCRGELGVDWVWLLLEKCLRNPRKNWCTFRRVHQWSDRLFVSLKWNNCKALLTMYRLIKPVCTRKNHLLGSISPHLIFSEQLINQILWRSCSLNFLLFSVQRNGIRKAHSLWLLFMVRKDKKLQLIKDKIPENAEIAQNNLLLANNTKSLCKLNTYTYAA